MQRVRGVSQPLAFDTSNAMGDAVKVAYWPAIFFTVKCGMLSLCHLRHNGCKKDLRTMTLFEREGQRSLVITEFTIHLFSLFQNRSYKAKEGRKTGIEKKSRYYRVLVVSIVVISGLHCIFFRHLS